MKTKSSKFYKINLILFRKANLFILKVLLYCSKVKFENFTLPATQGLRVNNNFILIYNNNNNIILIILFIHIIKF